MNNPITRYIYKNAQLTIYYQDTKQEDMSGLTIKVRYWAPSNTDPNTPTGEIENADITRNVDGLNYKASYTIDTDTLAAAGEWTFQIYEPSTKQAWKPTKFIVREPGDIQ